MFQYIYSQLTTKIAHKEITLNIIYSYTYRSIDQFEDQFEAFIDINNKIHFYRYFVFTFLECLKIFKSL